MVATYMPLSTGFYKSFEIYFETKEFKQALMLRQTEDNQHTEFISLDICGVAGEALGQVKCKENHELTNVYPEGKQSSTVECGQCSKNMAGMRYHCQRKTGYMRCPECQYSIDYCNEC